MTSVKRRLINSSQSDSLYHGSKEGRNNIKKKRITHVEVSSELNAIRYEAFRNCESLVKIILPESITEVGGCAFRECSSLQQINIPNSITKIGYWAFDGCESLIQIVLPESIIKIGGCAFQACSSLLHMYLPTQLQTIDGEAFKGCSSLSIIAVPDHVTIPSNCFDDCTVINQVKQQLNLSSYNFLHYQHRFANRPLHRVCYDPKLTLQTLTTTIESVDANSINDTDDFSMNALHILCSNPNVSSQMISTLVKACPSLLSMRSIDNMTPLMIFMRCKGIGVSHESMTTTDEVRLDHVSLHSYLQRRVTPLMMFMRRKGIASQETKTTTDEVLERISLRSCLQRRVAWEDIECMLLMDAEMRSEMMVQDEQTGLYPFMEPALDTVSSYGLDVMFGLIHAHPFLLLNNQLISPQCDRHSFMNEFSKEEAQSNISAFLPWQHNSGAFVTGCGNDIIMYILSLMCSMMTLLQFQKLN